MPVRFPDYTYLHIMNHEDNLYFLKKQGFKKRITYTIHEYSKAGIKGQSLRLIFQDEVTEGNKNLTLVFKDKLFHFLFGYGGYVYNIEDQSKTRIVS